jgi:hypothetical protein
MQARKERNRYLTARTLNCALCLTLNRNNEQAYLAGIIAKAAGRELERQGNTGSEDEVTRRLQAAFAASDGECVSCGQTLVKEGGHPLTWSADRVRSELGYMHPEPGVIVMRGHALSESATQVVSTTHAIPLTFMSEANPNCAGATGVGAASESTYGAICKRLQNILKLMGLVFFRQRVHMKLRRSAYRISPRGESVNVRQLGVQ